MKTEIRKTYKDKNALHITLDDGTTVDITPRWDISDHRDYFKKPRLYVDWKEWDVVEHLFNRTRRPYGVWRKMVRDIVEANGLPFSTTEMRWSQKAGCSMCPCSPGFILAPVPVQIGDEMVRYYDVTVTFNNADVPIVDESAPQRYSNVIL